MPGFIMLVETCGTEGGSILQVRGSCDLDEETQKVTTVVLAGYDGEDFLALDFEKLAWIALQPRAIPVKLLWNIDKVGILLAKQLATHDCPAFLKELLDKGKSILLRTENPSLSLLQKSPSSPVSCHATGFYPSRALMFWRKDGEEIHENVDLGEILPNNDDTFQMRIYLDISSISPEDWRRYDCVFQLIDNEEKIINLDIANIGADRERQILVTSVEHHIHCCRWFWSRTMQALHQTTKRNHWFTDQKRTPAPRYLTAEPPPPTQDHQRCPVLPVRPIVDSRRQGRGWQYLLDWEGRGLGSQVL
ncbi:major histocompatibility complex class I-related gene protein-like [Fundulus heteroclitus]|uniref:major histocompatibility complex class I-related gene protein-like n=1 Tax=Fundulus heteroclitus TaxID=8078 RepID=UPI00165A9DFC|nr:major histocompatibility complex class I-related gene protein-like [Fundulus heteroclitus]